MTEAIEQAEDTTVEPQPQTTTPEQQLALVERQMQERLRVLAANDPIYQRGDGQRDVLVALASTRTNGKVPDADSQ